jgi:AraC-like DNA-binding protein
LQGSAEIEQEKASSTVDPDSLAIIPGGLPYRLSFPQTGKRLLLRIPFRIFHERVLGRQIRDFGVHVFSGAGLVQITIDLLKSLVMQAGNMTETERYTVAEVTLELMAAVLRSDTGFGHNQDGGAQAARMTRILSYLEENYAQHDLTPAKVAKANAVSTRHLHNLFQHSDATVTKWIWERRLKAARDDILNPAMADRSITEIRTFQQDLQIAIRSLTQPAEKESAGRIGGCQCPVPRLNPRRRFPAPTDKPPGVAEQAAAVSCYYSALLAVDRALINMRLANSGSPK